MSASSFVLDLLDSEAGQVLQSWEFGGGDIIQLGRSQDCDVVLSSPVVSRAHAFLCHGEHGWVLSAVSRAGVFVEGRRADHIILEDGQVFRLAERGPVLRYRAVGTGQKGSGGATICFDSLVMPVMVLNVQQRDQEVAAIATGEYFQELQQKVARPEAAAGRTAVKFRRERQLSSE